MDTIQFWSLKNVLVVQELIHGWKLNWPVTPDTGYEEEWQVGWTPRAEQLPKNLCQHQGGALLFSGYSKKPGTGVFFVVVPSWGACCLQHRILPGTGTSNHSRPSKTPVGESTGRNLSKPGVITGDWRESCIIKENLQTATCRSECSHTRMSLVRLHIKADFFIGEIVTARELRRTAPLV